MRFQLSFQVVNGLVILDWRTAFDAVLAGGLFRKAIFNGMPVDEAIIYSTEKLPFTRVSIDGVPVYLTSLPEFDLKGITQMTYVRKQHTLRYDEILPPEVVGELITRRAVVNAGSTPYAMLNHSYLVALTDRINFVIDIDPVKLEEEFGFPCNPESIREFIMETVLYIGAKSSLGYGVVEELSVTETDRPIRRFIPYSPCMKRSYEHPVINIRPVPPYWKKEGAVPCAIAEL
jgi:hypothetical protein